MDTGRFGISGLSTRNNIRTANYTAVGVAGLDRNGFAELANAAAFRQRDGVLSSVTESSQRLGDRAAHEAWNRGVWFADYTYITSPYSLNGSGYTKGQMTWRNGREQVFGADCRSLPLFIDSCGYRREITATAPEWAQEFQTYVAAIELVQPQGYAAWDYPADRHRSMAALQELMRLYPHDVDNGRLWPVFSIRWVWDDHAHLNFAKLPGWAGRDLASMVPLTRTQKPFKHKTREQWVRQAIANALVMASDPDFRWMVERFGRVMLGGMVRCECPRMVRHIFTAVLCELFPECQFWLLGQANFAVVNGLGMLGLLGRVWTDGTWWLKDATCDRFAYVEDGLITMHSFETKRKPGEDRKQRRHTFFTLVEMMAANLRSLLAAYEGLWSWPPPEPLPLDLLDIDQVKELKRRYVQAQMELGL